MNCPNCRVPLTITERNRVEIDYCPQCRGVWLDRGELDKIIERSESVRYDDDDDRRPSRPVYGSDSKDYGYHQKKKKGFLGDLFDF
jgi:Zn-finger nucleic acid-binding protein